MPFILETDNAQNNQTHGFLNSINNQHPIAENTQSSFQNNTTTSLEQIRFRPPSAQSSGHL